MKHLLNKLELVRGQLIFVIGSQGLGKTRAMYELKNALGKSHSVLALKMYPTSTILEAYDDKFTSIKPHLRRCSKRERIEALRERIARYDVILLDLPDSGHTNYRLLAKGSNQLNIIYQ